MDLAQHISSSFLFFCSAWIINRDLALCFVFFFFFKMILSSPLHNSVCIGISISEQRRHCCFSFIAVAPFEQVALSVSLGGFWHWIFFFFIVTSQQTEKLLNILQWRGENEKVDISAKNSCWQLKSSLKRQSGTSAVFNIGRRSLSTLLALFQFYHPRTPPRRQIKLFVTPN